MKKKKERDEEKNGLNKNKRKPFVILLPST